MSIQSIILEVSRQHPVWDWIRAVGGPILYMMGALGLFLFGMKLMSDALHQASSDSLERILHRLTSNRFTALFTGFLVTAIVQSSSATTVMTVGFVNAGLMTLKQALGVIMGANIGTTITGWLVSILGFKIKITAMTIPLMGIALPLFFSKDPKRKNWAHFIFGFSLLFMGLGEMKHAIELDVDGNSLSFLMPMAGNGFPSTVIFLFAGIVLTLLLHSSSASMAITLTMAYTGMIPFQEAAAMVLGGNIGTTVDAFLAGLGANTNAKRASYIHIIFNVAGTIVALILFRPFTALVQWMIPGGSITTDLAAFHTLFNLFNTVLFIGFIPHLERFITRLVKSRPEDKVQEKYRIALPINTVQNASDFNLMVAEKEVQDMTALTSRLFSQFTKLLFDPKAKKAKILEEIRNGEDYTDQMDEELTAFLVSNIVNMLDERHQKKNSSLQRITGELESICDNIYKLSLLYDRKERKELTFEDEDCSRLAPYSEVISSFLDYIKEMEESHTQEIDPAYEMENRVNKIRTKLVKKSRKTLKAGESVKGELLYLDMVRLIEEIGDFCLNIAEAIKEGY